MTTQEKIKFIESYDYKVDIGETLIRISDPMDGEEGWKLIGSLDKLEEYLNETIQMIDQ